MTQETIDPMRARLEAKRAQLVERREAFIQAAQTTLAELNGAIGGIDEMLAEMDAAAEGQADE